MTSTKLLLHRKSTYLLHSVFLKCATAKKHLFVDLTFYSKQQALCVRPSTDYLPTWAAEGGGMHSQFTGFSMLNLKTGWTGEIMFLLIEKKKDTSVSIREAIASLMCLQQIPQGKMEEQAMLSERHFPMEWMTDNHSLMPSLGPTNWSLNSQFCFAETLSWCSSVMFWNSLILLGGRFSH